MIISLINTNKIIKNVEVILINIFKDINKLVFKMLQIKYKNFQIFIMLNLII